MQPGVIRERQQAHALLDMLSAEKLNAVRSLLGSQSFDSCASAIWGILAAGLFAGQMLIQVAGVATLLGFNLPLTYGERIVEPRGPLRVAGKGERQGLDLHGLGAGAYPEFLTHTEEFR